MQDGLSPLVNIIIAKLADKLAVVSKVGNNCVLHFQDFKISRIIQFLFILFPSFFQNPSKPQFNHYLFESICTVVR